MNAKTEADGGALDSLKLWTGVLILAGAIAAFYYFEDQVLVVRVLGLLAAVGVAILVAAQSSTGKSIVGFISGARTEMRRVVWPTRAETMQTTLAVLFIVFLVGIALWLLDMLLLSAIQTLTGQGG